MLRCKFVALGLYSLGLHHDPLTIIFIIVGEDPDEVLRKKILRSI